MENTSFIEITNQYRQQKRHQNMFISNCSLFLTFEHTTEQTIRLAILFILYHQYAALPLEQNPFLDFFLDLLSHSTSIEQHFIYCILEGSISSIAHYSPFEICNEPILPPIKKDVKRINALRQKVTKLIDDPYTVILDDHIIELLSIASNRLLALSENEALRKENLSNYPLSDIILPHQLPQLVNLNQFLAFDTVPLLLQSKNKDDIRSCDQLEEGPKQDKQVKQVVRFIQSLLEQGIIHMADYFVEIQAFCVSFMRIKGVAQLFRLASNEARQWNT
ncbi:hypothetical protein G6F71_006462 [Rhizopus microsporus]|nr:hypothetical protein G6F71_006462 [Rhizopus microsporus]KAG1209594.1 hypothetical protein G6F69_006215 [Rhizopus microsporus]KAG1231031.1 hypothetical protein G6F67_006043 [Rhizopus microsporus]